MDAALIFLLVGMTLGAGIATGRSSTIARGIHHLDKAVLCLDV